MPLFVAAVSLSRVGWSHGLESGGSLAEVRSRLCAEVHAVEPPPAKPPEWSGKGGRPRLLNSQERRGSLLQIAQKFSMATDPLRHRDQSVRDYATDSTASLVEIKSSIDQLTRESSLQGLKKGEISLLGLALEEGLRKLRELGEGDSREDSLSLADLYWPDGVGQVVEKLPQKLVVIAGLRELTTRFYRLALMREPNELLGAWDVLSNIWKDRPASRASPTSDKYTIDEYRSFLESINLVKMNGEKSPSLLLRIVSGHKLVDPREMENLLEWHRQLQDFIAKFNHHVDSSQLNVKVALLGQGLNPFVLYRLRTNGVDFELSENGSLPLSRTNLFPRTGQHIAPRLARSRITRSSKEFSLMVNGAVRGDHWNEAMLADLISQNVSSQLEASERWRALLQRSGVMPDGLRNSLGRLISNALMPEGAIRIFHELWWQLRTKRISGDLWDRARQDHLGTVFENANVNLGGVWKMALGGLGIKGIRYVVDGLKILDDFGYKPAIQRELDLHFLVDSRGRWINVVREPDDGEEEEEERKETPSVGARIQYLHQHWEMLKKAGIKTSFVIVVFSHAMEKPLIERTNGPGVNVIWAPYRFIEGTRGQLDLEDVLRETF
ncbi:MAG: hypothetical protein C5B49_16285 [Bdellovibrio sp.]|nr:MAG: hypothetical protein C5B49_16285 [Bdellovibrio sp.]